MGLLHSYRLTQNIKKKLPFLAKFVLVPVTTSTRNDMLMIGLNAKVYLYIGAHVFIHSY